MSTPTENINNVTNVSNLEWDESTEILLTEIADKAICYAWLYDKSYRTYRRSNQKLAIPVIIISTLIGAVTVSVSGYVPVAYIPYTQAGIGGLSLFNGILGTLNTYFRYAELSESHLNASNGWAKLYRNISIELKLARSYRKDINTFYRDCRRDYDRLMEMQLTIPKTIIDAFNSKFRKNHTLIKPEVCETLNHTEAYMDGIDLKSAKEHILTDETEVDGPASAKDEIQLIIEEEKKLMIQKESLDKRRNEILQQAEQLRRDESRGDTIVVMTENGIVRRPPIDNRDMFTRVERDRVERDRGYSSTITKETTSEPRKEVKPIEEIKPGIVSSMISRLTSRVPFTEEKKELEFEMSEVVT